MQLEALEACDVDVCGACGGVWIDWFDGEIRAVTSEALSGEPRELRPSDPDSLRNETRAMGACPRCTRQLVAERYLVKTQYIEGQSTQETGADLLRCEECAGAFVSRTAAETLATLPAAEEPPPPSAEGRGEQAHRVLDPLPWQKLLAALRKLLGLS